VHVNNLPYKKKQQKINNLKPLAIVYENNDLSNNNI